jgi:peptide/nickel transport system substrate-binding protein
LGHRGRASATEIAVRPRGWNAYLNWSPGAANTDPTANNLRADSSYFGWPNIPQVEAEISAWYDAKNFDEENAAARRLNKAALDQVIYAPLGFFLMHQAWRRNVTGIVKGPLPFFWGVSKTA